VTHRALRYTKRRSTVPCGILLLLLMIFLFSVATLNGQYYGMKFSGIDVAPNQRSGLHMVDERPIQAKHALDLEFFLRFEADRNFDTIRPYNANYGYVFRLVLGDQHIDLVHGFLLDDPDNFKLISGDPSSNISFSFPIEKLWTDWLKLRIRLDFEDRLLICYVNDSLLSSDLGDFDLSAGYHLMFGANAYGKYTTTDVPGMIIRDVSLSCNKQSWYWPLDETDGTIARSQPPGNNISPINPGWLLKDHNAWKSLVNRSINGQVKAAFDTKHDQLYLVSDDSLYTYSFLNDSMSIVAHYSNAPIHIPNHLIYDTINNQLLLYSTIHDYQSLFDPLTSRWAPFTPGDHRLTDTWHHNRMFTPGGALLIFGGYGHHKYLNLIREWIPDSGRFTTVEYAGEFQPRYLAASAYNPQDSLFYILGGFGSRSGRQSMSPEYYYELLSYSLEKRQFSKVFDFQNTDEDFCFSNAAYIDNLNTMYALRFSKHLFNNQLQLVGINLGKPEIIEYGNEIDYTFLDIASYSDLHFSKPLNALVALSTYTSDGHTQVAVQSIAYPPQPYANEAAVSGIKTGKSNFPLGLVLGFSLLSLIIASLLFYFLRKRARKPVQKILPGESLQKKEENSIILFGGFQVFDHSGQDITGQFSPLLKNLFLYILLHSLRDDKGVSNDTLYETFWFDKSVENARNNRSVNIIKLKSILESVGSSTISKETGYQKFYSNPDQVWIDYQDYLLIIGQESDLSREQINKLLSIIENKAFLKNTHADWLDPFKSEVSNVIIDTLLKYMESADEDEEFILHLTNCIFQCDPVSEEALKVRCKLLIRQGKHSLAKESYATFVKEYRQLYDDTYELSFKQLIQENQ